jgi:cytochrome c oxidase subunit 3
MRTSLRLRGQVLRRQLLHGDGLPRAHVIIGTIFLFICLMRVRCGPFHPEKHIGFEAAAWYWHFVDVVWLFLFAAVYIWGRRVVVG